MLVVPSADDVVGSSVAKTVEVVSEFTASLEVICVKSLFVVVSTSSGVVLRASVVVASTSHGLLLQLLES